MVNKYPQTHHQGWVLRSPDNLLCQGTALPPSQEEAVSTEIISESLGSY